MRHPLESATGWKVVLTRCLLATAAAIAVAVILESSPPAGAEAGKAKEAYGYDDTPLLPNSPWRVHDKKRPQPPMIDPGTSGLGAQPGTPPSDAVILFNGKDLSQWDGGDEKGIEEGCINIRKTGELHTKQPFGDCQLHVEWATPTVAEGDAMTWGNSGVFFLGRYELQIIESHDVQIYADGIAGAIYGQYSPLVNPARKPGEWQSYDVVFAAPRFDGDKLVKPAYFTVFQNGVLVQYHRASLGPTRHRALAVYDSKDTKGPIMLQLHGSAVRFRNLWIRPLSLDE
jgi:hypothetical protein